MLLHRLPGLFGRSPPRSRLPIPDFISSEQTVTINTKLTVAHGLGTVPTLHTLTLICKVTNLNYSVNDEVLYSAQVTSDDSIVMVADTTNIEIVQSSAIRMIDKTGFSGSAITTTSWRWIIKAWR